MKEFFTNKDDVGINPVMSGMAMIADVIFDIFGGIAINQKSNNTFKNAIE